VHGPEGGEVLEAHLRRAVFADRHAGVRAAQPDVRAADGGHAHEVVGARQERRKGRDERLPAAPLHSDRGRDHLLLGDEHLEIALAVRRPEDLAVSGVRDLAVERDHVAVRVPQRLQSLAVRLARRDLLADVVARWFGARRRREAVRPCALVGLHHSYLQVARPTELRDRMLRILERLAVLIRQVLDRLDAAALERPRHDRGRNASGELGLPEGRVDRLDVVSVDRYGPPAECARPLDVAVEIPAVHRLARLTEPIDVDDRHEVAELLVRSVLERLPHRALRHLAVAA
jgi:hypothetical protein